MKKNLPLISGEVLGALLGLIAAIIIGVIMFPFISTAEKVSEGNPKNGQTLYWIIAGAGVLVLF